MDSAVRSDVFKKPVTRHQLVTLEDLQDFKRELLIGIQGLLSGQNNQSGKRWLKTYQVRGILEISNGTLNTLRKNGTIPYSKIGGILYYDADEVNKVLESMKQTLTRKWRPHNH